MPIVLRKIIILGKINICLVIILLIILLIISILGNIFLLSIVFYYPDNYKTITSNDIVKYNENCNCQNYLAKVYFKKTVVRIEFFFFQASKKINSGLSEKELKYK